MSQHKIYGADSDCCSFSRFKERLEGDFSAQSVILYVTKIMIIIHITKQKDLMMNAAVETSSAMLLQPGVQTLDLGRRNEGASCFRWSAIERAGGEPMVC